MRGRLNRSPARPCRHPETAVLPGEDRIEFEKLHSDLITEFCPDGALEHSTVADLARFIWRKGNLATFRKAELASRRYHDLKSPKDRSWPPNIDIDMAEFEEFVAKHRAQEELIRKELGEETYALAKPGKAAEVKPFIEDLNIEERLDAMIDRCLQRLWFLKELALLKRSAPSYRTKWQRQQEWRPRSISSKSSSNRAVTGRSRRLV
jgi:hypothetical protein